VFGPLLDFRNASAALYPGRTPELLHPSRYVRKAVEKVAPRAEVPSTSGSKYLGCQPALSALNDTKGVSGAVATRPLDLPEPLSNEQPKSLSQRAKEEMVLWFSTLSYRDRGKLKMHPQSLGTPWWQHHRAGAATREDGS